MGCQQSLLCDKDNYMLGQIKIVRWSKHGARKRRADGKLEIRRSGQFIFLKNTQLLAANPIGIMSERRRRSCVN